jgi:hypothetical protein
LIKGEGYQSEKKIVQPLGIHHEIVKHISRDELNVRKVNFKWVPHVLKTFEKLFGSKFAESCWISWKARPTFLKCVHRT